MAMGQPFSLANFLPKPGGAGKSAKRFAANIGDGVHGSGDGKS